MDYTETIKYYLMHDIEMLSKTNKNKTASSLIKILKVDIYEFDYEKDIDQSYLFDLFDILYRLSNEIRDFQSLYTQSLIEIHSAIHNLLKRQEKNNSEIAQKRFQFLQKLIHKMENFMLSFSYENILDYDITQEEFIHHLIFKAKNIHFVRNACKQFPYIINSQDELGKPLVEKIIEHYLLALDTYLSEENLGPLDDLIYFDKVLETIFSKSKIKINPHQRSLFLEKLKDFYEQKQYSYNRHKEKLSFFINNAMNIILENKQEKSLDYLSYKYEVHQKFKEAHLLEAAMILNKTTDIGNASTKRAIYSFDGIDAHEIDDALSIEYKDGIYHFGIHIASPLDYIPIDSILMDEAFKRTVSLYMDTDTIPMFPPCLSSNIMHLKEGQVTHTISTYYDIDAKSGKLINFTVKSEKCKITKNLTYDDFDYFLERGCEDEVLETSLIHLANIDPILKEIHEETDGPLQPEEITLSEKIVANAMIYHNYQMAKLMSERKLPFIYRCHKLNEEEQKKLTNLQERLRSNQSNQTMIDVIDLYKSTYPKAYYSRKNAGHYNLELPYYSHFTSPLRRYADVIAHQCIREFIFKNNYSQDDIKRMEETIDKATEMINKKRDSLADYEIQYLRYKYPKQKDAH